MPARDARLSTVWRAPGCSIMAVTVLANRGWFTAAVSSEPSATDSRRSRNKVISACFMSD